VLVVGAGRTGVAVGRALATRGARVRVADRQSAEANGTEDWASLGIEMRRGESGADLLDGVDLVVPSPGVAATAPPLGDAVARGIRVVSEIEIAARLLACPIVAVTGTNGKSTTTTLIGDMLTAAGRRVFVGGNLGTPLIEAVGGTWDIAVAEVSSFQLEWVDGFRPTIGVLLNVTPDHLDRHGSMAAYAAAKARLFAAQQETDVAVLNRDDPTVWDLRSRLRGRLASIGLEDDGVPCGCFAGDAETIVYRDGSAETTVSLARTQLRGRHHLENIMAAVTVARQCRVPVPSIQSVIDGFRGLPHRCEFLGETRGVRYYDDSKATNVGAVMKSLEGFAGPVVLVAGGLDKGGDFSALASMTAGRVRLIIAYGAARERIATALSGVVPVECVERFAAAVRSAMEGAHAGDTVLLAPGCASFDQFRDYGERGRAFRDLLREGQCRQP
jgi:UDP-N-acetylmuramoylalanine--D-glutamate ligase